MDDLKPLTRVHLDSLHDMFEKLLWEQQNLVDRKWHAYDAFNFVVTAHHLYVDWLSAESGATLSQLERKAALPLSIQTLMQAVLDISNGSKHSRITSPNTLRKQVVSERHAPTVMDWHAYFFGDKPYWDFSGFRLSIDEIAHYCTVGLRWVLYGEGELFPQEELERLEKLRVLPIT